MKQRCLTLSLFALLSIGVPALAAEPLGGNPTIGESDTETPSPPDRDKTGMEDVQESPIAVEGEQPADLHTTLSPTVIKSMKEVHKGIQGQSVYVAQFGDSITNSRAFWTPVSWSAPEPYLTDDDQLPKRPRDKLWKDCIQGAGDKGPRFANGSGWTIGRMLKAMDQVLNREKPQLAIVMIGTNDISGGKVPATYREDLKAVVKKCIDAHCIPILNTIPPRRGRDEAVSKLNSIVREVAREHELPLADYHAACLRLRPGESWDGTIISQDGVHPTAGKTDDFSEDNLKVSGYALRTWVNFLTVRQLYFRVIRPKELPPATDLDAQTSGCVAL